MNPYLDRPAIWRRLVATAQQGYEVVVAKRGTCDMPERGRRLVLRPGPKHARRGTFSPRVRFPTYVAQSRGFVDQNQKPPALSQVLPLAAGIQKASYQLRAPRSAVETDVRSFLVTLQQAIDILISNSATPLRWAAGWECSPASATWPIFCTSYCRDGQKQIGRGLADHFGGDQQHVLLLVVILAVLAEYVARILEESQERPLYFIEMEAESSAAADGRANRIQRHRGNGMTSAPFADLRN